MHGVKQTGWPEDNWKGVGEEIARTRGGLSALHFQGVKSFYTCSGSRLVSPAHLLDCWGISQGQLFDEQDLCFVVNSSGLGVGFPAPRGFEIATCTLSSFEKS
ncbi:hypothetical protein TNCV_3832071 [Trichonephila clavipes]|nr:hypothetical protein TNCV_3832071 [Trichonephila clavipes]